jgi:hypothetical protein
MKVRAAFGVVRGLKREKLVDPELQSLKANDFKDEGRKRWI